VSQTDSDISSSEKHQASVKSVLKKSREEIVSSWTGKINSCDQQTVYNLPKQE